MSIQPGAEQLWRTQEGAHGDVQNETWPRGQAVDGASRRGRMCWIASVLMLVLPRTAGEALDVSPNSPAWEMGASRKRALSASFISARLSQRWRSWTSMVDIAFPRIAPLTFVHSLERSQSPCAAPASTPGRYYHLVHLFERLAW